MFSTRSLLFFSLLGLYGTAYTIDVVWINPDNQFDSRFDAKSGLLKASTENIPSLEIRAYPLPDLRRSLYDKNGHLLAVDLKKEDVLIASLPSFVELFGDIFTEEFSFNLKTEFYQRNYPYSEALAHAVGYASPEKAFSGIEVLLNDEISVTKDSLNIINDFSTSTPKIIYKKSKPNKELSQIRLGLDAELQLKLYQKLKKKIKEGVLLISNSLTGEIPVMLSFPSFDPNASVLSFENNPTEPFANRIYRNYESDDWDSLRDGLRFKEEYEVAQLEASRNYAQIMGVREYVPSLKSITPLYLLTLLQHLTYSPQLQLSYSKKEASLEHEDLKVWNYADRYFFATRVGSYTKASQEITELKKATVLMGSVLKRRYNFILILEGNSIVLDDLEALKKLIELTLGHERVKKK